MAKIKLYIFLSEAVLFVFIEILSRYTALEQSFTEACMRKDSSVLYKVHQCVVAALKE